MSSTNNNDIFPYGEYPTNIAKLMQIASEDPNSKEKKLLQCMAWCKDKALKFNGQILMNICIVSFEMKGKFLHEMNSKEEVKQTIDDMIEEYEL
jgi:hypothetical protein